MGQNPPPFIRAGICYAYNERVYPVLLTKRTHCILSGRRPTVVRRNVSKLAIGEVMVLTLYG